MNRKKTILIIFVWSIVLSIDVMAQNIAPTIEFEKQRRARQALDKAINATPSSKELHERFIETSSTNEEVQILQDAVKSDDRSIVPYLKARRDFGLGPAQHIDIALVALGETQYVDLAIEELNSEDPVVRYYAVWRLARFKTKASYQKLYELLDDVKNRDPVPDDDQPIETMSWVTKDILYSAVDDPPSDKYGTKAWKKWFKKNDLIDQR